MRCGIDLFIERLVETYLSEGSFTRRGTTATKRSPRLEQFFTKKEWKMIRKIEKLEGRRVTVMLRDGSRLDHCRLISSGRGAIEKVWVYAGGIDVFLARGDVVDILEAPDRTSPVVATTA